MSDYIKCNMEVLPLSSNQVSGAHCKHTKYRDRNNCSVVTRLGLSGHSTSHLSAKNRLCTRHMVERYKLYLTRERETCISIPCPHSNWFCSGRITFYPSEAGIYIDTYVTFCGRFYSFMLNFLLHCICSAVISPLSQSCIHSASL